MGMGSYTPHHVDLIYAAALASFWRRKALRKFLRGCGVAEGFLATWTEDEPKRQLLDRLFLKLGEAARGHELIARMSAALCEQKSFPDLKGWEDSEAKIREAHDAVEHLRRFERNRAELVKDQKERETARARNVEQQREKQRSQLDLQRLLERLDGLATRLGDQRAGYEFQDWFYDLLKHFEIVHRRPYVSNGRQIDGSLTIEGTTYLVELKFTREQAGATDIDTFYKKVAGKADNTMGVMVSISGYSSVATSEASGPRTPLLLLDHGHIYAALTGAIPLPDILARVRRHASQTSEAYLPITRFDG